jgi:hypothetical protein
MRCALRFVDEVMGVVHVTDCPVSQTARLRDVFGPGQIVMSFPKKFICFVKATTGTQGCINREWIIDPLPIIDGRSFDLVDCGIDLANRFVVVMFDWGPGPSIIQIMPGGTQIA